MDTVLEKSFKSNFKKNTKISSGREREKMYGCEICGKSFTTQNALVKHIGVNHEGKKKKLNVTFVVTDVLKRVP